MKTTRRFVGMAGLRLKNILYILIIFLVADNLYAQKPTVGLIEYDKEEQQDGYVLFAPLFNTTTYLINKCGEQVHKWESKYKPGLSVYLLPDGSILRAGNVDNDVFSVGGGAGGIIERISWDGTILWSYMISDSAICQHHDIHPMPNGNVLVIVWELKSYDEVVGAGRDTAITDKQGWFEKIIEIEPTGLHSGEVVWEWKSWDHLVQEYDKEKNNYNIVALHSQLIDINYLTFYAGKISEWLHFNSIDYNSGLDQILISSYGFSEVWILDHSTTTNEASSHTGGKYGKGGDLLYRWGNPEAYNKGTKSDRKFFGQHTAHWISNGLRDVGKIMVFNNGAERVKPNYSSVEIIAPPTQEDGSYFLMENETYGPEMQEWIYIDSSRLGFAAPNYCNAQRLPNGNILICLGPGGNFYEVTSNEKIVWRYINPASIGGIAKQGENAVGNSTFRAEFYPKDFPGFTGRDLTTGVPIEIEPYPSLCTATSVETEANGRIIRIYPNPADHVIKVHYTNNKNEPVEISLYNSLGEVVSKQITSPSEGIYTIKVQDIPNGMYMVKIFNGTKTLVERVVIAR